MKYRTQILHLRKRLYKGRYSWELVTPQGIWHTDSRLYRILDHSWRNIPVELTIEDDQVIQVDLVEGYDK